MTVLPLQGFTVAVPSERRADEQIRLLEGCGATCIHGPVIETHAPGSEDEMRAAIGETLRGPLDALGADVIRVPLPFGSIPSDTSKAERMIRAVIERRVDAVTFTARAEVENLLEIGHVLGVGTELVAALGDDVVPFCIDPPCATGLTDDDLATPIVPEEHGIGAMVQQVAGYFAEQAIEAQLGGSTVRIQGRLILFDDGEQALLSDREHAVLSLLLERPGVVRSKRELLTQCWRGSENDEHLVEVTVGRLRQRLGPVAPAIETVIRRGYRASPV